MQQHMQELYLVKQDQLKNAGTGDVLPKVDEGIDRNLETNLTDTRYKLELMLTQRNYDEFGEYFMSLPKGEQSTDNELRLSKIYGRRHS